MKMEVGDALKEVIARKRWTKVRLATEAGYAHVSAITAPIQRGNVQLNTLIRLLDAAGFKLEISRVDPDPEWSEPPIELILGTPKARKEGPSHQEKE